MKHLLIGSVSALACALACSVTLAVLPGGLITAADVKPSPPPAIRAEATSGFIGVNIDEVEDALAYHLELKNDLGIMVVAVNPGSPAETMGLKPFDVIVAVDGQPIYTPRAFSGAVRAKAPGDQIQIQVRRGPRSEDLVGKVVARPADLEERQRDMPPWMHHGPPPTGPNGERRGKLKQPDGSTMEWSIEESPTPPAPTP